MTVCEGGCAPVPGYSGIQMLPQTLITKLIVKKKICTIGNLVQINCHSFGINEVWKIFSTEQLPLLITIKFSLDVQYS